jgi:hypothetical protein
MTIHPCKTKLKLRPTGLQNFPLEVLQSIVDFSLKSFEPEGLHGASAMAKQLVAMNSVCRGMHDAVVHHGYKKFADILRMPAIEGLQDPQQLIEKPASVSIKALEDLAVTLGFPLGRNKDRNVFSFYLNPLTN